MSASVRCPHSDLDIHVNVVVMSDTNVRSVEITARCKICEEPMRFIGVPMGISLARPTVSVDGEELRVPMVPASEEPDKGTDVTARTCQ